CYGAVTINQSTGAVSYNADYYTLGQFSKFVDSGAYRIESNSFDNDVEDVAFKNPDGSKVLVVDNTNTVDKSVKVKWGSESVTYTIPADSAITFKWSGSQLGSQISEKPAWYQNFETGSGFTAGTNATAAIDSSSANTGGSKSVKLTNSVSGDPGSSAQCVNVIPQIGTSFDASPYSYLNFYVKDTQGVNTVKLTFVDKNNAEYSTWTTTRSAKDQWIPINFALCSITGIDTTAIKQIRVGEWNPGVYYFDDFHFAADSTFVIPAFGVDKTALTTAIGNATTLLGSKIVGVAVGNIPQAAKDAFQSAITAATAVNANTSATKADVDAQVAALETATTNFNSAVIVAPESVKSVWYQNFETGSGFTAGTNATVAIDSSSANTGGLKSVKLTTSVSGDPLRSAQCVNVVPSNVTSFDTSSYSYLNFYVKDMQGANTVKITFVDTTNAEYSKWITTKAVQNQWTPMNVSLSSVTGIDKTAIKEIRVGEWNTGVYYFDDFYFSADSTFEIPAPAVDKTALTTATSNATTLIESKTVGTAVGNVPQAAKDTFQSAITAATAVIANTAATQAEADVQIAALATATTNFNSAVIVAPVVDETALTTATGNATTLIGSKTVGTAVGNVPQASKDTFQGEITAATVVIANTATTQADADAQIAALAIATTNFNSAVIVAPDRGFQRRINKIKAKLDSLVKAGDITQTQEDDILKSATTKLNKGVIKTGLDCLVKAGIITQAQVDAIVKLVIHTKR
ncbi:MAG TPA: glycoside hydrolase family 30 beta sandwich domain-containing protein, partial [Clostridium sp.]